jgi:hypothetical protein
MSQEVVHLSAILRHYEVTLLKFIPVNGPRFEPGAVDLMADMSAAAQSQLNRNVLIVSADILAACREKLKAGDHAASRESRWFP